MNLRYPGMRVLQAFKVPNDLWDPEWTLNRNNHFMLGYISSKVTLIPLESLGIHNPQHLHSF